MSFWLYVTASAVGGLLVGVLGTGSSLILLPSLALIFSATMAEFDTLRLAAGTTMATIAVGAIAGAIAQYRAGQLDIGLFRLTLLPYALGSLTGPWLSRLLSTDVLALYLAAILVIVALRMLFGRPLHPASRRDFRAHRPEAFVVLLAISLCSSVAGVASGIFAIPYLSRFSLPLRRVIGTSTASAAVYASCGAIGYISAGWSAPGLPPGHAGFVYVPAFAIMATTALIVTPLGVQLARFVNERLLQRLFALFLLAAAAAMLSSWDRTGGRRNDGDQAIGSATRRTAAANSLAESSTTSLAGLQALAARSSTYTAGPVLSFVLDCGHAAASRPGIHTHLIEPMASKLHIERLDTIVRHLLESGARSVLDLGCGDGELLLRLAPHAQFDRLVGIDIDAAALAAARRAFGLDPSHVGGRIDLRQGSFETADAALTGFDAAALVETIEHIDAGRLSRVERAVFAGLRPRTVLLTTPNQEYNVLHGLAPGERRHPGHRFEWSRTKFRQWSRGVASRNDYTVAFFDLGPMDPLLGSTTQMARFVTTNTAEDG